MLSQPQGNPPKLHSCVFFLKKLTLAERNYDISNSKLKLSLEEWKHWLEGAHHPFTVLTDHMNLEYLCDTKRLNLWQARWALFFSRLNFSFTYHPESRNTDFLSHIHASVSVSESLEPVIPSSLIVCPIQWSLSEQIANVVPPKQFRRGFHLIHLGHLRSTLGHRSASFRSNICIFVIVDRFSKSCWLVPLNGLTIVTESAELLFNHAFCYFGLPEDLVLYRSPQLISHVWKGFFTLLGVTVSLSSGYHLQTNSGWWCGSQRWTSSCACPAENWVPDT